MVTYRARAIFVSNCENGWYVLREILEHHPAVEIARVYTSPEKDPRRIAGFRSFDELAQNHGVPIEKTDDLNASEHVEAIRTLGPCFIIVVGWSRLVSKTVIEAARDGALGMHPTLLPEGRGRAPIPWSIIKGLKESGVTLFYLTVGVDDGDIVGQERFTIEEDDDARTVYDKATAAHVALIRRCLPELIAGNAPRAPQDHSRATYWPRRRPEDGRIDWSWSARRVYDWVRALTHPYPGAFTSFRGETIRVWRAALAGGLAQAAPGTVVRRSDRFLAVAAGEGCVRLVLLERGHRGEEPVSAFPDLVVGARFDE